MEVFAKDFKFVKNETDKQTEYHKKLYCTFFNYSFFLGYRKSEGLGLKWKHCQSNKMYINSALNTKNVKKYLKNKSYQITVPKTSNSIREMKFLSSTHRILKDWKDYCTSLGMDTSDDNFIFIELNGLRLNLTTLSPIFKNY